MASTTTHAGTRRWQARVAGGPPTVGHDKGAAHRRKVEGLAELERVCLALGLRRWQAQADDSWRMWRWWVLGVLRRPRHKNPPTNPYHASWRNSTHTPAGPPTSSCPVTNTSTPPLRLGCASSELMWCLHCWKGSEVSFCMICRAWEAGPEGGQKRVTRRAGRGPTRGCGGGPAAP